jgi:membrane associated rhomboid family serine protease
MRTSDRNYVRFGPRASSGLGNLRFISFNTWLIILNVAVFGINFLLSANPAFQIYTPMGQSWRPDIALTDAQKRRAVVIDKVGPDPENPGWLAKPIVDPDFVDPASQRVVPTVIGRDRFVYMGLLESLGHFSTAKAFVPGFQVWRFITFQFIHYNWIHLLFNMLGLWFVGGLVEQHLGFKRYAAFYLTCGIFGALFYLLLNLVGYLVKLTYGPVEIPGLLFNDVYTPLIGASAGVFGILIAAARLEPMATVWIYFLIPVRLRTAVTVLVLITLYNLFNGSHNAGGEAAHVGGILAGFYFIRRIYLLRDFFDIFGNSRLPSRKRPPPRPGAHPPATADPLALMEHEVERILQKSELHGVHSLSPAEHSLLRQYNELIQRG